MRYEYTLKDASVEYLGKTSVSFSVRANVDLLLTSITLYGVKSAYVVDGDIEDIVLQCNVGGASVTVGGDTEDVTFVCGETYPAGTTVQITISVLTSGGTFSIPSGIDAPTVVPADGAAGLSNTSTRNIPHFAVTYDVDDTFAHNGAVNDGYFYLDGLLTEYGDYSRADWHIDPTGTINDGYMYLDGLLTEYGDYDAEIGSKIYYNGHQCPLYYNGVLCKIYYNGH